MLGWVLTAAAVDATTNGAAAPQSTQSDKAIVLGMSGALSGASSKLGAELQRGMRVYFDDVNATGGVAGRNIVLQVYDDGYEPQPAIRNTLQLIEQDHVLALLAYIGTPTVTRVLPVLSLYKEQDVLLFFPFTGAEPQRRAPYNQFAYNLRPSYRHETTGLVDGFISAGRTRIALFYQADAYGRSGWVGVRMALENHGLEIAAEATYRRGSTFKAQYAQQVEILRQSGADAVISIASYAAAAGFIRDARDAEWPVPIANVSFVDSDSLKALMVQHSRDTGKDYTHRLVNSEVVPNYRDSDLPAVRDYLRMLQANTGTQPSFVSFEGFLNARLMTEILRRMGDDIVRSRLREVTDALTNYDIGIEERVSFGPNDNQGLERVYFNRIEEGDYVAMDNWARWLRDGL